MFGQVDGTQTERLSIHLQEIGKMHGVDYSSDPRAYVFALNTYIAIIAKSCAAFALAEADEIAANASLEPIMFLETLESNEYFELSGIQNMLSTDFFSWYLGDDVRSSLTAPLGSLLARLCSISFDMTLKDSLSVRDLFKGLYMGFVPSALRHALGEYYTPDWLAAHVMDMSGWEPSQSMLDPTCGSGTFLLEALKRRLAVADKGATAQELLSGIYGFDLNPLAVLTARASIAMFLSGRFSFSDRVCIPVYLADAINTADPQEGLFTHTILTEKGARTFAVPEELARRNSFFELMDQLKTMIDGDFGAREIWHHLVKIEPEINKLRKSNRTAFFATVENLVLLHQEQWDGIWCPILYDRIAAGCVSDVDVVIGNPPWVKWSHLPRSYADFIKPLCRRLDIFSEDSWVGGIQSDISTVITYHALERFVRRGGTLAFLITGTVLKNESSQGFRRWQLNDGSECEPFAVVAVEDYSVLKPFEGAANTPVLLIVRRGGEATRYPVEYTVYDKGSARVNAASFGDLHRHALWAAPVPGTVDGPWMVGSREQLSAWAPLFDVNGESAYRARKGITTDANGIFFVRTKEVGGATMIGIENDPRAGRRSGVARKSAIVERRYVYPLVKGRNVRRFKVSIPEGQSIVVPQEGMKGDWELPSQAPRLYKYLASFKTILEQRSSYRRFQQGDPFWSVWTCGEYTFAPYKVIWKEMSGHRFVAAYVGSAAMPGGELKVIVPDHKVYFVPVETEEEAAYLTGFLNSPAVSSAVSSYAASLSLGASVTDYLRIPAFDPSNSDMIALSRLARRLNSAAAVSDAEDDQLDVLVTKVLGAG